MSGKLKEAEEYAKALGLTPGEVVVPAKPGERTRVVYAPASPNMVKYEGGFVPAKFETVGK